MVSRKKVRCKKIRVKMVPRKKVCCKKIRVKNGPWKEGPSKKWSQEKRSPEKRFPDARFPQFGVCGIVEWALSIFWYVCRVPRWDQLIRKCLVVQFPSVRFPEITWRIFVPFPRGGDGRKVLPNVLVTVQNSREREREREKLESSE